MASSHEPFIKHTQTRRSLCRFLSDPVTNVARQTTKRGCAPGKKHIHRGAKSGLASDPQKFDFIVAATILNYPRHHLRVSPPRGGSLEKAKLVSVTILTVPCEFMSLPQTRNVTFGHSRYPLGNNNVQVV